MIMLLKYLSIVVASMVLISCTVRPANHVHQGTVTEVQVSPQLVHVSPNIIHYRDTCDQGLLHNRYVSACDQYIELTTQIYISNVEVRKTRERFLRHRHRYRQSSNQHDRKIKTLLRFQNLCDKAIDEHRYISACDRYIQLSHDRRYRNDPVVHQTRVRYQDYKREYKKRRRNMRIYKKTD